MSTYKPPKSPYYHFDFQFRGDRFHGSTGCTSKRAADAFERKKREEVALGERKLPPITVDAACLQYWQSKGQHQKSRDTVEYQLANLVTGLGKNRYLHEVRQSHMQAYVDGRRETVGHRSKRRISPTSINREIELAKRVWSLALLLGFHVPIPGTKDAVNFRALRAAEPKRQVELKGDQEAKVIDALPKDLAAVVAFALLSGQRKSAIIGLIREKIDWTAKTATVEKKGGGEHTFPMTEPLEEIVKAQPEVDGCPYVFTYECRRPSKRYKDQHRYKGQRYPFSAQGWQRDWKRALTKAGVADFRFHDLRHTSATRLLRACGNLKAVQKLLGHSDVATTARYAHVFDEDLRDAMNSRDKSRNSPEPSLPNEVQDVTKKEEIE